MGALVSTVIACILGCSACVAATEEFSTKASQHGARPDFSVFKRETYPVESHSIPSIIPDPQPRTIAVAATLIYCVNEQLCLDLPSMQPSRPSEIMVWAGQRFNNRNKLSVQIYGFDEPFPELRSVVQRRIHDKSRAWAKQGGVCTPTGATRYLLARTERLSERERLPLRALGVFLIVEPPTRTLPRGFSIPYDLRELRNMLRAQPEVRQVAASFPVGGQYRLR